MKILTEFDILDSEEIKNLEEFVFSSKSQCSKENGWLSKYSF